MIHLGDPIIAVWGALRIVFSLLILFFLGKLIWEAIRECL